MPPKIEQIKPNQSEVVSSKMFDLAEKVSSDLKPRIAPEDGEYLNKVGNEFASGNYDGGQRLLEKSTYWDDELRGIATEVNRAEQERTGEKPLEYEGAKSVLDSLADQAEKFGTDDDKRNALIIRGIARGTELPGEKGINGIDGALKYLEDTARSVNWNLDSISDPVLRKELTDQIKTKRAARDALYVEKQRRVDELKQSKSAESSQKSVSASDRAIGDLGNLYNMAEVPEETPSRQELQRKVARMSEDELSYFNNEMNRLKLEYDRSGDKRTLDAALSDLTTKKFTKDEVVEQREQARKTKLGEVRRSLGMSPEQGQKVEGKESPEVRFKKYKAYEGHKGSVEKVVKNLQEARNTLEKSNNISSALLMFEGTISILTQRADPEDIEKLRGQPVNIEKEKQMFGIEESALDEYTQMREAQNALVEGKSVKEVLDSIENELSDKYGVSKTETEKAKTIKDLDALKIAANVTAESTDDPKLVGNIKEIRGVGYHIPDVPQYNVKGELVNTFNKDINARPNVVTYKLKI